MQCTLLAGMKLRQPSDSQYKESPPTQVPMASLVGGQVVVGLGHPIILGVQAHEPFIGQLHRMGKAKGSHPIKDLYWIFLKLAEGWKAPW